MRVLCHAQHLSGVGHYVRMQAIAGGLARAHEVYLVAGGRPVPRAAPGAEVRAVSLPAIGRENGVLVALDGTSSAERALALRASELARAVERIRPDALLVDHYPFSKWELEGEITAAIDAAVAARPEARIVCSLRDVAPQTRQEHVERKDWEERVLAALGRRFHALLVHADRRFTRLEEHFSRADEIPVPIHYTGFVLGPSHRSQETGSHAVLSCGGGARDLAFLLEAMEAFRRAGLGAIRLLVFAGAFAGESDRALLERAAADGPFEIRPFAADFEDHLRASVLSISRAGYNTCAALLATRVPAVLVADPAMSDQPFRARRMSALGLAIEVADGAGADHLADAMRRAAASPPAPHDLGIGGVERTRELLEDLVGARGSGVGGQASD